MTELIPPGEVHFQHGTPHFEYDECYSCFEGRTILFRLVNRAKQQWAFYNDTTDTIVKVHAVFGPGSQIKGLQRTKLTTLPAPASATGAPTTHDNTSAAPAAPVAAAGMDGGSATPAAATVQEARLEIEPGFTELFIEGTVTSFNIDFLSEAAPATDVNFEYRRPTVPYDKIYKCFKNQGNGLLFRLVDEHKRQWHFYNDTKDYLMKVTVEFAKGEDVSPMGKTKVEEGTAKHYPDGVVYTLEVAPGKTEAFIEGTPSAYSLGFAAEPFSEDAPPDEVHYENGTPDLAIIPHLSRVYKCFKEHGNGLLFRIVDDVNHIWAFYNDTKEYDMTVNVRLPPATEVKFAPGVNHIADVARPGGVIASVQVRPLTTAPFLVGAPIDYELAFSATPANVNTPEPHPHYDHGGPDLAVMEFQEVYKCFKEHGNGLLFRLVDTKNQRWGFYNDTTDLVMTARVAFDPAAKVRALDKTMIETDPEMGVVYTAKIPPLATLLFAEGEVGNYTTRFLAAKATPNNTNVYPAQTSSTSTRALEQQIPSAAANSNTNSSAAAAAAPPAHTDTPHTPATPQGQTTPTSVPPLAPPK